MGYTKTNGQITSNPTEASAVLELTGDFHYAVNIFIHNLTASDTVQIRVYLWNPNGTPAYQLYSSDPYNGTDTIKALHFAFMFLEKLKITFQRTAGSNQVIDYQIVKIDPPT
jgi:hypothetical protein